VSSRSSAMDGNGRPALFLMANTLETGGSERQFATLARALHLHQFELKLGCLKKRGPFAEGLGEITEFPPEGSLFNWKSQRARFTLGRYLRAHRVVIAHSFDFYSNFMLIPSARLARIPVVIGSQRQLGDLLSGFRNSAQHAFFRWCDRVVCNSQAAAQRLEEAGIIPRKLKVIPNALPEAAFANIAPALPALPDGVRVVMVARMNDPAKRHDIFLKAAARVAAQHRKLEFVLVGDGPLRPGLEAMAAKLGLQGRVLFLGDRRDVSAVLASCDVSVLSSVSESLSNAIMESMASGLPVIACRVGGNDELIRDGENGFLVSAGNDEEMAERISMLVRQRDMRLSLGETARGDAQTFTVERVCAEYESLYESLLEEKGIARQPVVHSVT
jgi:glycosyltransferase involved in cell wall biosynthesis